MEFIKLEIAGIGSYVEPTTIDLTKFNDGCIFNIAGPTGVGKTTILDCLTLALYGKKNNGDENDADIRSTQAAPEMESYVKLTFKSNGKLYRIERTPKYKALVPVRKNSKNLVEKEIKASKVLYELDAQGKNINQYSKDEEFKAHMNEIVDLTFEQFLMTSMMRQGGFVEVLNADSDTRTKIFRQLFNTKNYHDIEEALKNRHKEAKDAYYLAKKVIEQDLDKIDCTGNPELEAKYQGYKAKRYECCTAETLELLEELVNFDEQQKHQAYDAIEKNEEKLSSCAKQLEKLQEQQELKQKLVDLADELTDKTSKLKILETDMQNAEADYTQNYDNTVRLEQEQEQLLKSFAQIEAQEKLLAEDRGKLQEQRDKEATAKADGEKAEGIMQEKKVQLDALGNVAEQIALLTTEYTVTHNYQETLKTDSEKITNLEEENKTLNQTLQQLRSTSLKAAQDELNKAAEEVTKAEDAQSKLVELAKQDVDFQSKASELKLLGQAVKDYQGKLLTTRTAAANKYSQLENKKQAQNNVVKGILNQFLGNKAMEIAHELQEGEVCPVCGGVYHVATAPHSQGTASAEDLANARKELTRLEEESHKAYTLLEIAIKAYEDKAQEIRDKGSSLFQTSATATIEEIAALQEKAFGDHNQHYASFSIAYKATQDLANSLSTAKNRKIVCEGKVEEVKNKVLTTTNKIQTNNEQIKESSERLMQALDMPPLQAPDLLSQIKAATAQIASGDLTELMKATQGVLTLLQHKVEEIVNAGKAKRKDQETQTQLQQLYTEQQEAKEKAQQSFTQAQLEIGKLEESCKQKQQIIDNLKSNLQGKTKEEVEKNKEKLGNRKKALSDAKTNTSQAYHNLEKEIENKGTLQQEKQKRLDELQAENLPSETEVLEAKQAALAAKPELQETYEKVLKKLHINQSIQETAKKTNKKRIEVEKKYKLLEKLYDLASGNTNKSIKLPLETFVQAYYMDKVVDNARSLLTKMSDNRFELVRRIVTLETKDKGNKKIGLDLNVIDKVNNTERSVRTLSGGESFAAAMALIISLSQIVEIFNGNNRNNFLFIDEGYGSLDANLIDLNIAAMEKLSTNGLTIGIISHVSALEERISKKLVVDKVNRGSYETSVIRYEGV